MGIFVVRGTTVHVDGFCSTLYTVVRGYDHEGRLLHFRYTLMWATLAIFRVAPSHMLVKRILGSRSSEAKS
ncbi:hypothetical protein SDC9_62832 [bioreactor metagenome]|uniref:Uncharacterized protein n=1 Tax=bioreactor metagenome TaxID=1076179 RepID=A0A644XJT4_9ZZZZ